MSVDADSAGGNESDFKFEYYHYNPSLPAAIVSVAVFAILTSVHVWKLFRFRTFYFTAFTIGGVFQCIGYCGRIWAHFDDTALGGFVMQAILILVAPALYAASIYMILGRLIRTLHAEDLSSIPVKWLTKIFVAGDVVAFGLQGSGGGIQAGGTSKSYKRGERIILAGLFVQIAIFSIFVITASTIHRRIGKSPTPAGVQRTIPWRRHLYALYASSVLILVRSIFRVIEYIQGNGGYLFAHEIFLYIFDALLMAMVMVIFAVWYVADLQKNQSAVYALSSVSRRSVERSEMYQAGQSKMSDEKRI
ncbi:RTA1 protein [Sarocladium strictum]